MMSYNEPLSIRTISKIGYSVEVLYTAKYVSDKREGLMK